MFDQPHKKSSSSFCPAKWDALFIDLENGMVKSCHYPQVRKLPLKELKKDASAFHNSKWLKSQRLQMLKGKRPKECSYCWDLEDRKLKSPRLKWLERKNHQKTSVTTMPKRVEVSFSSLCQLKCGYCSADTSSSIAKEHDKFGSYFFETYKKPKISENYGQYFWSWFESVYDGLEQVRVTGGEPFLSKDLKTLLDYIESHPHPSLNLSINSNLSLPSEIVISFLNKVKDLIDSNKMSSLTFFTSLDSWGEQAEYIRAGLKLDLWQKNIDLILKESHADIVITNTFSTFSIESVDLFIKNIDPYIKKGRVKVSFSKLQYPRYLALDYASFETTKLFEKKLKTLNENDDYRIYLEDLNHLYALTGSKNNFFVGSFWQQCLRLFIHEYDRRKKTQFTALFPQLDGHMPKFKKRYYYILNFIKTFNPKR